MKSTLAGALARPREGRACFSSQERLGAAENNFLCVILHSTRPPAFLLLTKLHVVFCRAAWACSGAAPIGNGLVGQAAFCYETQESNV